MTLESLKYFIACAKHLNFTKAAERCHITQTAMSFQIASMEKELGFSLFERDKKKVVLTEAGSCFYDGAQKLILEYDLLVTRCQNVVDDLQGGLRIVCTSDSMWNLVSKILKDFREAYPSVQVSTELKDSTQFVQNLLDGATDICVSLEYDMVCYPKVVVKTLLEDQLYVAMPPTHKLAAMKEIVPEMLIDENMIVCDPDAIPGTFHTLYDCQRLYGFQPKKYIKMRRPEEIAIQIKNGRGISFLTSHAINDFAKAQDLIGVPFLVNGKTVGCKMGLGYLSSNQKPALNLFLDFLEQNGF